MPKVYLQFETVRVVNDGLDDGILNSAVVQVDANFVADAELSVIRLL